MALKSTGQQPLTIHYNQHVVLQCLMTGLISPVMIIRRVDHATTVVGGRKVGVGPCGYQVGQTRVDEALGDSVSQLHKIRLQIVQDTFYPSRVEIHATDPKFTQSCIPPKFLACHNDVVDIHETAGARKPRHVGSLGSGTRSGRKRRETSIHKPVQCRVQDLGIPSDSGRPQQDVCETFTSWVDEERVNSNANGFQSLYYHATYLMHNKARSCCT